MTAATGVPIGGSLSSSPLSREGFGRRVLFGWGQMFRPETVESALEHRVGGVPAPRHKRDILYDNAADNAARFLRPSAADRQKPRRSLTAAEAAAARAAACRRRRASYMMCPYMALSRPFERELKRGSLELVVLSLLEARPRHGYEISKLIEQRSDGVLRLHVASLYPLLYRLERRGWLEGRWLEQPGQRARRHYRLTREGRRIVRAQRRSWRDFARALDRLVGFRHA
jgi:transcriptional regulator